MGTDVPSTWSRPCEMSESVRPRPIAPIAQDNMLLGTAKLWKCTADSILPPIGGLLPERATGKGLCLRIESWDRRCGSTSPVLCRQYP